MISGIKERKGIITITGDVGTGKTTLIYALLKDLSDKIKTAFIFNPRLTFKQLLKAILEELKVPVAGESTYTLLYKFNLYLKERMASDETVVIIIDEAQNLRNRVLQDFVRLYQQDTPELKLVQTLLVGQLELEANLDSEELLPLKHRINIQHRINPLDREESKGYIDHRLRVVGSDSSKIFTPEAIDLICEFSKGIPRMINNICDGALFAGYSASVLKIDAEIVKEAIADGDILAKAEVTPEEEIIAEKEGPAEKEAIIGDKITPKEELVPEEEAIAEEEVTVKEEPIFEKESPAEKEAITGEKIIANEEVTAVKEVSAQKKAVADTDDLKPQQAGDLRSIISSLEKKRGISGMVSGCKKLLARLYRPGSRRDRSKGGEQNPSSDQRRTEEREEEYIKREED